MRGSVRRRRGQGAAQHQIDTHRRPWCKPPLVAGTKDEVAVGRRTGADVVLNIRSPGTTLTDDAFSLRIWVNQDFLRAYKQDSVPCLHPRSRIETGTDWTGHPPVSSTRPEWTATGMKRPSPPKPATNRLAGRL